MDETSLKGGYLFGALITFGILLAGFLLNPLVGFLLESRFIWPNNMILMLVIVIVGIAVSFISSGSITKRLSSLKVQLPAIVVLLVVSSVLLVSPVAFNNEIIKDLLSIPSVLLCVYVFFSFGLVLVTRLKDIKKYWLTLLIHSSLLLFILFTVVGYRDYYVLKMKVGPERAIFEANNAKGRAYKVPFAIKALKDTSGLQSTLITNQNVEVRVYETVSKYEDVRLSTTDDYRLKGWIITLSSLQEEARIDVGIYDLCLVFDRWWEFKLASLVLLVVGLIVKIKY